VIAARGGDNAGGGNVAHQQIGEGTARLEGARMLQQLELEEKRLGADAEFGAGDGDHRRFADMRADEPLGRGDPPSVDRGLGHAVSSRSDPGKGLSARQVTREEEARGRRNEMRPEEPRLPPLPEAEWSEEQRALLMPLRRDGRVYNIFATLARHPKLLKRWLPFANHLLFKSSLATRDRELLILRVAWLARSRYEWGQHAAIARREGLSAAEIERVAAGPEAAGWSAEDRALLGAADELWETASLGQASWAALERRFGEREIMDLVFTVGGYVMLAMALNSFGVALDPGIEAGLGDAAAPGDRS
jgi:4-carboxymuconolactone decarboxylase